MSNDFTLIDLLSLLTKGLLISNYQLRKLWATKQLDAFVAQRRDNDGGKFVAEVDDVCPYVGGYQYLIARFMPAVKGWHTSSNPEDPQIDPLSPSEEDLVAAAHVHELVGDLSEGLLSCSYNEDDIRELWRNQKLNHQAAFFKEKMPLEYKRFKGQMGNYYLEDGNYQDQLTRLIGLADGWPVDWTSALDDLDPLTAQEREMVEALKIKMSPITSHNVVASVNGEEVINYHNYRHGYRNLYPNDSRPKLLLSESAQRIKIGMAEFKREQKRAKRLKQRMKKV
jgi:hypothetical protein